MSDYQMGTVERLFAEMIWDFEPVYSTELAQMAAEELGWKKSTTYTVLKRLCQKGIFQNEKGCVTALVSRHEFDARRSRQFVKESFDGSLPAFLAAFTYCRGLSKHEVEQIQQLIARYEEMEG